MKRLNCWTDPTHFTTSPSSSPAFTTSLSLSFSPDSIKPKSCFLPLFLSSIPISPKLSLYLPKAKPDDYTPVIEYGEGEEEDDDYEDYSFENSRVGRHGEEKDYDRDPEIKEILTGFIDDPENSKKQLEERIKNKRNKILQTKAGSAVPMKVIFNKFGFSNSYIWFEFHRPPLSNDVTLLCDAIRAWHIIGRLGGCNSMNMQLSQSASDRRLSYDATQGANVTPTTFYNIGDLEIQHNLARIWVDIGTSEPLLLDMLINALSHISSDYVGIKQVVFGGSEFEDWKEGMTSDEAEYSMHKI
ncbi:hypothetical protein AMTRI_Chr05g59510 [Amborella trichopoda]